MTKPTNLELLHMKRLALERHERGLAAEGKLSPDLVRWAGFSREEALRGAATASRQWAEWRASEVQTVRNLVALLPGVSTNHLMAAYNATRLQRGMVAVGKSRFHGLVNSCGLHSYFSRNPGAAGKTRRWEIPMDSHTPEAAGVPA